MSINRVTISGNLTRDPELRSTASGTQVLQFGVAVNERRKDAQGNWSDYANFVDCTMFGQRAASIQQYLSKGSKVAIDGRLRYSSWEKDGQRRSKLEVIVEEIEFMSKQQNGQQPQQAAQQPQNAQYGQQQYQQPQQYQQAPQGGFQGQPQQYGRQQYSMYDEDVPF